MHQQPAADVEFHEEVLAVAAGGLESSAFETALQLASEHVAEDLLVSHLDRFDLLVQRNGIQILFEDFDVGKFRHRSLLKLS
jgi:hypothetical protein